MARRQLGEQWVPAERRRPFREQPRAVQVLAIVAPSAAGVGFVGLLLGGWTGFVVGAVLGTVVLPWMLVRGQAIAANPAPPRARTEPATWMGFRRPVHRDWAFWLAVALTTAVLMNNLVEQWEFRYHSRFRNAHWSYPWWGWALWPAYVILLWILVGGPVGLVAWAARRARNRGMPSGPAAPSEPRGPGMVSPIR